MNDALMIGSAMVLVLCFTISAAGQPAAARQHPFLYFSADELPRLRERLKTPPFDARFRALLANADRFIDQPVMTGAAAQIGNSRRSLGITSICSFAYAITAERKYADRARAEVLALVAADRWHEPKNWNKGAELPTAELSLACALFYDWCHDTLDEQTRNRIATRVVELGIQPYLTSIEQRDWWVKNPVSNWCGVCHGGIGVAALALSEESPDARRAAGLAREHLIAFLDHAVGVDGGGHEGVMYWRYGMEFTLYFLTAADRNLPGPDLDAALAEAAEKLAGYWDVAMQAPDGKYANFNNMNESTFEGLYSAGRAHEGGPNGAICALMERLAADANGGAGDRLLLWAADNGGAPYYFGGTSPFWFLWRRPDAAPAPRDKPALPDAMLFRTAGHTIWKSPDLWLAYNCGWTSDKSHYNRDLGSFVLVYNRERLVADPGYGHSETANHSTIVIDGGEQVRGKGATYLGWHDGKGFKYLVSDLSEVYPQPLDRFERQLVLVEGKILILVDDLAAPEPHAYEWRLQTRLTPAVDGAAVTIGGERAALHVVPVLPESANVGTGKQQINYVSIKPIAEGNTRFVTVLYPDAAGSKPPRVSLDQANDRATLRVSGENGNATLEFSTSDGWRLASVNGEAAPAIKPPTERTFKPLR